MTQTATGWHEQQADQSLAEMRSRMIQIPEAIQKLRATLREQIVCRVDGYISLCESELKNR